VEYAAGLGLALGMPLAQILHVLAADGQLDEMKRHAS
jgi:hypothetical protein